MVYGECHAVLDAVDALMLRTVVHKGAADVLHPGNHFNICDKDRDADEAFQDCHDGIGVDDLLAGICDEQRQHHEDADGHDHGKYHDNRHKDLLDLLAEYLVHPQFQLTWLGVFIILEKACGKA